MDHKAHLRNLTNDIQTAVNNLNPDDSFSWLRLQEATEQMRCAVVDSGSTHRFAERQGFHNVENLCLVMAEEIGLFVQLASNKDKVLTVTDLSDATGYNDVLIARVMRGLASIGFVDEVGYQVYAANSVTMFQSQRGAEGGLMICTDMLYPLAQNMRKYLRENKPCELGQIKPAYDFAMGESCWVTFKKNPEWKNRFDEAMTLRVRDLSIPWFVKYPIKEKLFLILNEKSQSNGTNGGIAPPRTVIVDVGGGQGRDLQALAEKFPDPAIELILQDLPETLDPISSLPSLNPRIKLMPYDFFTPQPIKEASIYYFKSILHDWNDAESLRLLSNTAKAMNSQSRLLINEMVLADRNENSIRAHQDILLMCLCNGIERTKTQWTALLAKVDPPLKIVDIYSMPGDAQGLIETCLA